MDLAKKLAVAAAIVLSVVLVWSGLAVFAPVTPWLPGDFYTLYSSVVAVSRGISPYDHAAIAQIQQTELAWDAVALRVPSLPFFYPPWYVLLSMPLVTLPFRTAAVGWLVANFLLLMAGCLLVFRALRWPLGRWLFPALAGAALFAPTLGDLVVGQYGMPVLFGVCLIGACSARSRIAAGCGPSGAASELSWGGDALIGLGLVLLTLKPQLGIAALLVTCAWLVQQRRLQPLAWGAGLLVVLGIASFRVSPNWPVEMITAQASYAAWAGVPFPIQGCDTCSTVAAVVESAGITGPLAVVVDSAVMIALAIMVIAAWRRRGDDLIYLLSLACVATVLGTPYLRNYDLVILLLPSLVVLYSTTREGWRPGYLPVVLMRVLLGVAYVLPLLGTFAGDRMAVGRSGVAMAGILLVLLLGQIRSMGAGNER